ncbi:MAG: glycosyltransferase family 4 protein [Chthoniobacteraceae bacterium]
MSPEKRYRLLQVFNHYLESGGEEASVHRIFDLLSSSMEIHRCAFESRAWKGTGAPPEWRQAILMIRNPAALEILRREHEAAEADAWLVHNVFPVGSAAIYRAALKRRVPIIYYIHNFRPFSVNGYLWAGDKVATGGLRRNFWKEIRHGSWQDSVAKTAWLAFVLTLMHQLGWFKAVKAWVAISDFMREKFIEAGVPRDDVFTVRHSWRPMEAPPQPRDGGYYLFLGRLIPAKGIRVLFDAWRIVREQLSERAPRLVIGGAGPMEAEVSELAARNPQIEFRGIVKGAEKDQLLGGCRAMIAPSLWWEPLGLVTYEAYDFAKPMLAARSGGLTETVGNGQTGFLHEPGDAAQLARQVLELDASPRRRIEMGQAGRAWLLENTSEKEWLRKFTQVVEYAVRKG